MGLPFAFWKSSAPAVAYLLDTYSGSSAAYSLRKLSASTSNVVRVRRSSDNAEQDFTATEITDGTLTTFTGVSDGFVAIWYDQSGNSFDAAQTAASSQPKIVSSGSVILENGKPAIYFDNSNDTLVTGVNLSINNIRSFYSVNMANTTSGFRTIFSNSYNQNNSVYVGLNINLMRHQNWIQNKNNPSYTITTLLNTQYLVDGFFESGTNGVKRYINSSLDTAYTTTKSLSGTDTTEFSIGASSFDNNYYWGGTQQELILYSSANTTNRTGIENNINAEYTIY